ncbi:MAG: helix-turn-helix transcriptional regulator [Bacteroidota bacterium]
MTIHIGSKVRKVFEKSGMTVSEFARRINKSRENVYSIFNRKSIDTELLQEISRVLQYDFFELYHHQPKASGEGKGMYISKNQLLRQEIQALKREIRNQQKQLDDLREKYELVKELNKALSQKAGKK